MTLLLAAFWPGLAGAAMLGGAVGYLAGWPAGRAVPLVLLGLTLGLMLVAALRVVPGLPGLWVEAAALMLPLYLAGCALGALGHRATDAGR